MAGIRQMIKGLLRQLGFSAIVTAENGKVGYDLLCEAFTQGQKFDLILSDWNMPIVSGIALLKLVRAHSGMATTPFLLITAEKEFVQVREAIEHKVNSYIVKPFTPEAIKIKLDFVWKQLKIVKK